MPLIIETSIKGLQDDFKRYEYDIIEMRKKFKLYSDNLAVIQGKWTIDICFTLLIYGVCSFNDIRRALPDISTRTLTDRLRYLEQKGILKRSVVSEKKIRVYYQLREFGKQLIILLVPALLIFVLTPHQKKDFPKFETLQESLDSDVLLKVKELVNDGLIFER